MAWSQFEASCNAADEYPKNVNQQGLYPSHVLEEYKERLDVRNKGLFCQEPNAAIDVWRYDGTRHCSSSSHEYQI
jgi:hypothetical protein